MGHRLSRIYTRTGDDGSTGLGDGSRTDKDNLRVEAYGTVDELNSLLGVLIAQGLPKELNDCLLDVQHDLFDLGGELCIPGHQMIRAEQISHLEQVLDQLNADLPMLKEFILPGGSLTAATCHLARTVCRRAERHVVSLSREASINPLGLAYINRLSDLLFVMARVLVRQDGGQDVLWNRARQVR